LQWNNLIIATETKTQQYTGNTFPQGAALSISQ
jgi:hypothetical protein